MATYYIDPYTGDDSRSAATAQTSSTPWKTLINLSAVGPSTTTLSPGDVVKLRGDDLFDLDYPGSDFAWTNNTAIFTSSDLGCQVLSNFLNSSTWTTYSGTLTTSSNAYYHDPSLGNTRFIVFPSAAFTGKLVSITDTGTIPTSIQGFSFLVRLNGAVSNFSVQNVVQIKLCSDTAGDTAVVTIDCPNVGPLTGSKYISVWVPFTTASPITFNSIGIYAKAGSAAIPSLFIDNLVAVTNGYRHFDLIKAPDGTWNPIGAFTNTGGIVRDRNINTVGTNLQNFPTALATETPALIKSADWRYHEVVDINSRIEINNMAGTSSSKITIQGGYDPTFTNITGHTVYNGRGQMLTALRFNTVTNVFWSRVSLIGTGQVVVGLDMAHTEMEHFNLVHTGQTAFGSITSGTNYNYNCTFNNCNFGYSNGANYSVCGYKVRHNNCNFYRGTTYNVTGSGYIADFEFNGCKLANGTTACVFYGSTSSRNINDQIFYNDCEFYSVDSRPKFNLSLPGGDDPMIVCNNLIVNGFGGNLMNTDERSPSLVFFRNLDNRTSSGLPTVSVTNAIAWPHMPKMLYSMHGYSALTSPAPFDADYKLYYYSDGSYIDNVDGASESVPSPSTRIWRVRCGTGRSLEADPTVHRLGFFHFASGETKTFTVDLKIVDVDAYAKLTFRNVFSDGAYDMTPVADGPINDYNTWEQLSITYTAPSEGTIELVLHVWSPDTGTPMCYVGDTLTIT